MEKFPPESAYLAPYTFSARTAKLKRECLETLRLRLFKSATFRCTIRLLTIVILSGKWLGKMARDRPVLGIGYGEFASPVPLSGRLRDGAWYGSLIGAQQMEDTRYAHNELLHLWAECGLLGLLAFVWMIGCVGWILLDHLRRGASLYV